MAKTFSHKHLLPTNIGRADRGAWIKGFNDRRAGKTLDQCPYPAGLISRYGRKWQSGWESADTQVKYGKLRTTAAPTALDVLRRIVAAWESVPEDAQVPEAINVDELWDTARFVIDGAQGR